MGLRYIFFLVGIFKFMQRRPTAQALPIDDGFSPSVLQMFTNEVFYMLVGIMLIASRMYNLWKAQDIFVNLF